MDENSLAALLRFYRQIDDRAKLLRERTGLTCPNDCGWCCETAEPDITTFEAMPLARLVLSDPELTQQHENFVSRSIRKPCFFYNNATHRCTVYPIRPMICRMFGFAAARGKMGDVRFAPCRHMKRSSPSSGIPGIEPADVPIFAHVQSELLAFAPAEVAVLKPFPDAIAEAIERELLLRRLAALEQPSDDEIPDRDPTLPTLLGGPGLDLAASA